MHASPQKSSDKFSLHIILLILPALKKLWQNETVLCIAALCALITMPAVPPDAAYLGYIDCHVLVLLFALMAVVAGFKACGLFTWLTGRVLSGSLNGRMLGCVLVWLPYFCAMLVTNDVALLVFVPFTIGLLDKIKCSRSTVPMLVLQTVAANLGSMFTPVGNPQNLFLYSNYHLSPTQFFGATLPFTLLGLALVTIGAGFLLPHHLPDFSLSANQMHNPKKLAAYGVLFLLCLLSVFRLLADSLLLPIILIALLLMDKHLLRGLDYALLATFVCFFIVSGNLGRMEAVHSFLQILLADNTLLTAAATSQFISNVPAAVLLSTFTNDWKSLLLGVDIGGLGTPVASLASLITLKIYLKSPAANIGRFMIWFSAVNFALLALLLSVALIII